MGTMRSALVGLIMASPLMFNTAGAAAASLQPVNDWDGAGLPSDVSMYAYVPDNVAADPPLLVLIHYCGGTAPAVFGQAQGGGVVQAADEYGFIILVPSSGRCWDVVSDTTRTRNGNGDSGAIRRMVTHAITAYGANASRVYATGDSSGGMMTELLLALYPEVFKAGSAMAGMPAGCRGPNESGNGGGYSGACAGGNVSHTPREWGDLVRSFYPGYTGPRPRVQLFHGDEDDIIDYNNHIEAIAQWRDVLGLEAAPTNESGLQLGAHAATRQTWIGECGMPVLDAFTSLGGDHGPADALFLAEHLIPFLGLDDTGTVDPVVAACDNGATGGMGPGAADSGTSLDAGGAAASGGAVASGGAPGALGGAPSGAEAAGAGLSPASGAVAAMPGGASGGPAGNVPSDASRSDSARGCNVALQHRRPGSESSLEWLVLVAFGGAFRTVRKTRRPALPYWTGRCRRAKRCA